ncbi:DNA polymerase III alpha subunit [Cutibacterium acnes JCM 18918]|nr:DNA polymerase III alpha subunit [Cutibacterium acnes JCM 18918]
MMSISKNIALDDKTTYEMLARGDTLGVFQLDGTAMSRCCGSWVRHASTTLLPC